MNPERFLAAASASRLAAFELRSQCDTDSDGDGQSDLDEALASTSPTSPDERLTIINFAVTADGSEATLTWTSTPARLYSIETCVDLAAGAWLDIGAGAITPDAGVTTALTLIGEVAARRFFRVKAQRPLAP